MLQAAIPLVAKYAVPALATTGALFGGKQAYEQSGGDLGAAALGAGLGAAGMGALPAVGRRMAGSKMGQDVSRKLVESGTAGKVGQGVDVLSLKGPLASSPLQQQMVGQQALGALGLAGLGAAGLYAVPRLAGGLAGGTKQIAGNAAKGLSQAVGLGRAATYQGIDPTTGQPVYTESAVPGNLPSAAGLLQQQDLLDLYQGNLLYRQQLGDVEMDQVKKQTAYMAPVIDKAKQREMLRQLAAAKVRQDLATGAQLTAQGQLGAQRLAQQGMGAIGQGLTAQYQYG